MKGGKAVVQRLLARLYDWRSNDLRRHIGSNADYVLYRNGDMVQMKKPLCIGRYIAVMG